MAERQRRTAVIDHRGNPETARNSRGRRAGDTATRARDELSLSSIATLSDASRRC